MSRSDSLVKILILRGAGDEGHLGHWRGGLGMGGSLREREWRIDGFVVVVVVVVIIWVNV